MNPDPFSDSVDAGTQTEYSPTIPLSEHTITFCYQFGQVSHLKINILIGVTIIIVSQIQPSSPRLPRLNKHFGEILTQCPVWRFWTFTTVSPITYEDSLDVELPRVSMLPFVLISLRIGALISGTLKLSWKTCIFYKLKFIYI